MLDRSASARAPGARVLPTALVLSGGGARGAYQVGVVAGIVDVLGLRPEDKAPFGFFVGMSAGALNASYLASHADVGTLTVDGLADHWRGLRLTEDLRLGLCGRADLTRGQALLDTEPIERMLAPDEAWTRLHRNIGYGLVDGLVVPALHVPTGQTTVFAELAPGVMMRPWSTGRRIRLVKGALAPQHLLASLAIPLLFPARLIDGEPYCDGGLRMCSPLAPAVRAGASRIVVITLRSEGVALEGGGAHEPGLRALGHPLFLAGKVLDGLLLDPIDHDVETLRRINGFVGALERTLEPEARARVDAEIQATRGAPYTDVEALVFAPSRPLTSVVLEALDELAQGPASTTRLVREVARRAAEEDADLVSFLLFDGAFTSRLIELGRHDALARADEVRAFFLRGE